ncbi:putative zinc metalloprotease [Mycena galericulata]|nr:putative zinc metalloprotease [Mycena galericulata]
MKIVEAIAKVLAFRTLPTTVLVVLVYGVLFGGVLIRDRVPDVPKNQKGLDLAKAYEDLHYSVPHPFISHANDIVHTYILDRIRNVTAGIDYIDLYEDLVSNASWASWALTTASSATYNEATNILVKIEGSDPVYASSGGVLFSAHYDSSTDDGMGVATLMQLSRRTAIFNINNGEENGLCGAFTHLLNLEGAAAGGRPLLFRATSTPALRSFHVPHPHGNVLSADAFARGVIRSGTDYTGLDLAFYKGRSKYHTKFDSIPHTVGQERALWSMMESTQVSGLSLLDNDDTHGAGSPPVYFDLFGAWFVLLSLDTLLISNIVLLVVGPVILVVLVVADAAILHGRSQDQNGHVEQHDHLLQRFWKWFIEFGWLKGVWIWAKFWVAVLVTLGLQALLVFAYMKLNPFIAYSQPGLVFISSFTLTYLTLVFVITPSSNHLPERQKHIMFLQVYILTWLLLLLSTIAVGSGIGGVYFVTAWNAAVLLACTIGCIENMFGAQGSYQVYRRVRMVHYGALPQQADTEATESTPLIHSSAPVAPTKEESGAIGWWILQLILAVSVPVTLVSHIAVLLIGAMAQTLADGSSAVTVYAAISILVFMIVLPVVPFTFKVHSSVASVFIVVFLLSIVSNLVTFPFSQEEPVKVYFRQTVDLGNLSSPHNEITYATTSLNLGLETCRWNSTLLPSPGAYAGAANTAGADAWLKASVTRLANNSARFIVTATNTRGCALYFDNQPVKRHWVHGSEPGMLPQFSGSPEGIGELRLWSRTWDRTFTVDTEWEGDSVLEGRIACEWAEYESGTVGLDSTAKIPALEEVVTFLPRWVAVSPGGAGLVAAWVSFAI